MNSSIGCRAAAIATAVMTVAAAFGIMFATSVPPAGAVALNPCRVLKRSEIQQAFGGLVSGGKHGPSTRVSAQCQYEVGADGDRPPGTVTVHLVTKGAKAAYKALEKTTEWVPIDGVPHSLYAEKLHVVTTRKGKVLLGVQGGFTVTDPLPIHFYDDKSQLIDLVQTGSKRV